jgi:chromosome partitioning protein
MITTALINMKGGVGKTTLAVNLAHACYRRGQRVLLVDLDPQFNASQYLMTYNAYEAHKKAHGTVADVLLDYALNRMPLTGKAAAKKDALSYTAVVGATGKGSLRILPAQLELSRAIKNPQSVEYRLQKYLTQVEKHFDRVFIDCAPTDTVLTASALTASHCVLVPIKPDRFSILGYEMVKQLIEDFRRDYPDPNKVTDLGVVFTLSSPKPDTIEKKCKDAVRKQAPYIFTPEIPHSKSERRCTNSRTKWTHASASCGSPKVQHHEGV